MSQHYTVLKNQIALENFTMSDETPGYHVPVLLGEVMHYLAPKAGDVFVDATLGGGGHSEALLKSGATVIGFDQDAEAIHFAHLRLHGFHDKFRAVQANFQHVERELQKLGITQITGALIDAGVSSKQLDTAERGFSFLRDGDLDMRMATDGPVTAADLVNTAAESELMHIFREYGEEPSARRVAMRIVQQRAITPFTRTLQLADFIASFLPKKSRIHPATRCFQALRIAVNQELEVLSSGLEAFARLLAPGGRLGVISFHSGEDRIVKTFMKERATEWLDRPEWPKPRRNPLHIFRLLTNRPVIATDAEQHTNPRSRSAKLRVAERLPYAS